LTPVLRAALGERLPEYMVPSAFVFLDAYPLTPNGKIDRRALPEPAGIRADVRAAYVAPRDALEDTIAAVWRQVLGVERVGRNDNFFDLGGHSLLMAQLRTALAEHGGHQVSMVELFQHPTVAALAGHLSGAAGARGGGSAAAGSGAPAGSRQAAAERAKQRRQAAAGRQRLADRRTRYQSGR
jgi:aryl carrier-like protein